MFYLIKERMKKKLTITISHLKGEKNYSILLDNLVFSFFFLMRTQKRKDFFSSF